MERNLFLKRRPGVAFSARWIMFQTNPILIATSKVQGSADSSRGSTAGENLEHSIQKSMICRLLSMIFSLPG
jgi:hypothetical protein